MGELDRYFGQQLREIETAMALYDSPAVREAIRQSEQYRTLAEKMALDYAPLLRGLEAGAAVKTALEASLGGWTETLRESERQSHERLASVMDAKVVMPRWLHSDPPIKLWYG